MSDFTETIRRSTQRAAREKLLSPERVQTGRAIRPGGAGGSGLPMPTGRVAIAAATAEVLVKATHCGKWLWCDNKNVAPYGIGVDKDLKMPPDPAVGDPYYFMCYTDVGYHLHLRPNTGQTIIMPSEVVTAVKFVDLDYNAIGGMGLLILVCSAANTWICVDASTSYIGSD